MESQRFDQLTKGMATRGNRRSLLRGLTGLTASGMALLGIGSQTNLARSLQDAASTEEQSVILYEEMGKIAQDHAGSCVDLANKFGQFHTTYSDLIPQFEAEQAAWTKDKRTEHAETYGDRREVTTNRILAALSRCSFDVADATSGLTPVEAASGTTTNTRAWQPLATPVLPVTPAIPIAPATPAPSVTPAIPIIPVTPVTPAIPVTPSGTEQPAADASTCDGEVSVACVNFDTGLRSAFAVVPATCGGSLCTPCVSEDYCSTTYPDICSDGACAPETFSSSTTCTDQVEFTCLNSNTFLASPYFLVTATCDGDDCTPCADDNYCSTAFPDICPPGECALQYNSTDVCCGEQCPFSTAKCMALGVAYGLDMSSNSGIIDPCVECEFHWCSRAESCYECCESSDCCTDSCSSS